MTPRRLPFVARAIQGVLSVGVRALYRVQVEGQSCLPENGPVLILSNHVSLIDWIFLSHALKRLPQFVIHKRYYDIRAFRPFLKMARVIPILTGKEDRAVREEAFARVAAAFEAGAWICVFPEGKLTRDGYPLELRPGFERILQNCPVPTVVVVLDGLYGSFFSLCGGPAMRKWPMAWRSPVHIRFLACLTPEQARIETVHALMTDALR